MDPGDLASASARVHSGNIPTIVMLDNCPEFELAQKSISTTINMHPWRRL